MIIYILILGFILRIISLNQSLWLDEAINTLAAKNYSFLDLVTKYAQADFHPPGWSMLIWFWTKLFGYSEVVVRIPSVIFGVLTIWFVFLIGKKLFSEKLGLLSALIICLNPLHIYYSQEARMYALATLAVCINIFLLIRLIKGEKFNIIFLVLSNLSVLFSDYIAYFIFPSQFIFLIFLKRKEILKKWMLALFIAILLGIWWLPIFLSQLQVGAVTSSKLPSWKLIAGAFDFKTIPLTFVKFIIGRISLSNKLVYGAILLPICSLFIYLLWKGIRTINSLSRNLFLIWLIIPMLLATGISIFIPVYSYFRVLYIIPAFIILIALGILTCKKKLRNVLLISVVLIELFCSSIYLLNPQFHREDWRGVANFFASMSSTPIILFESSGTLPPFDYYAKNKLNAFGALRDFPSKEENDVIDLENLLRGKTDVYLVNYLVEVSDSKRFVSKRLERLGFKIINIKNFTGIGFVYHYSKNV